MVKATLFAFDVHGVFITRLLDDPEVLGGYEVLRRLKSSGRKVALIASGSNWSTKEYTERMRNLGYPLDYEEVWPASRVAAIHLKRIFGRAHVLVLGERGLAEEMEAHGHYVVEDWRDAEAVVVGFDRELNFDKVTKAIRAVHAGAYFLAVNKVRWYYMPNEGPIMSPGALVAAIEYQTRREAVVVGKPSPIHFIEVLNHFGVKPEDAVMVGDDVEADMMPARSLGMKTVLVNFEKRGDAQRWPRGLVDLVVNHVDELVKYLD
ncbi:HAD-IIA family hydrolase [Pyrobaculum arsenaticum]|uniref:HAD-superfamily hydrolase, subfamily IIA n=1 Tax=Pyrobaculum arsenaticum (strain DSM 13514 / JCM 11321 / PZ6) TaxID=340102 RepID=A4WI91_PYRAR|nr:HAD-IIA family hydrolase [Pyrobaculum arsenaticum]ABP50108.1 HAD-superfamily hydrolase, subfamily IIA [Pyrobaculum arsenaticum DSM 13514]